MAEHETTSDIIAEMRGIRVREFQEYADRLEVALKRELSKNASKNGADFGQLGDAAKLREALKQVNELNDLWFDTFTLPDGATSIHDEIEDVISAALAAPTRNCDRPECATLEMATKTWIREEFGPHCNNSKATMGDIRTFDVWIYATATEKEGGDK